MSTQIKIKRNRILLGQLVATTDKLKLQSILAGVVILYAYRDISYKIVANYIINT